MITIAALTSSGCGSSGQSEVYGWRSVSVAALEYLEEMEGELILVIPADVGPELRTVLRGLGNTVSEEEIAPDEEGGLPGGYARFEGLMVAGDYAEFGARVGPIGNGANRCGTKYRLIMDRRGSDWALRQYFVGGC